MKFFNKFKPTRTQLISAAVLASSVGLSLAVTLPITFTSGTTAKAADVNSNFGALATAVTTLETTVAGLVTKLSTITGTDKALPSRGGKLGYAWSGSPATALNTPTTLTTYSYNSAGQSNVTTHTAVGKYSVTFGGLGILSGGVAQVSAYNGGSITYANIFCSIDGWLQGAVSTDEVVNISCYTASTGALTDAAFTVSFMV